MNYKTIVVEVMEGDIASGKRKSCGMCPVALAIKVATWGRIVHVGNNAYEVDGFRGVLPDVARTFIFRFDDGEPVHPITFKIRVAV